MCDNCALLQAELDKKNSILKEWGISDQPPIQIYRGSVNPIVLRDTDTITAKYLDNVSGRTEEITVTAKDAGMSGKTLDHMAVYTFYNALGYKHAVAGIFGEKIK